MDDFDKKLKQQLENRPHPAFDEADWDAMKARLDGKAVVRTSFWRRLWWTPLLFLLLGGPVWLFYQWYEATAQMKLMEASYSANQIIVRTDTIFQSRIVYKTDTVFMQASHQLPNIPIEESPSSKAQFAGNSSKSGRSFQTGFPHFSLNQIGESVNSFSTSLLSNIFSKPESYHNPLTYNGSSLIALGNKSNTSATDFEHGKIDYLPGLTLGLLSSTRQLHTLRTRIAAPPVTNHFLRAKKGPFDNIRFYGIDLEGGLGYHHLSNERLSYQNDIGLGLGAMVHFSRSLDLWIDATYTNLSFETGRLDEGLGLPEVLPPSPDLKFVAIEAIRPSLLFSIGAMYTHPTGSRLRPQLGLGLNSSTIFAYDLIYEYRNEIVGSEWNAERSIPATFHFADQIVLKAGAKYALSDFWRAYARCSYYRTIDSRFQPNILMFQSGLSFSF